MQFLGFILIVMFVTNLFRSNMITWKSFWNKTPFRYFRLHLATWAFWTVSSPYFLFLSTFNQAWLFSQFNAGSEQNMYAQVTQSQINAIGWSWANLLILLNAQKIRCFQKRLLIIVAFSAANIVSQKAY